MSVKLLAVLRTLFVHSFRFLVMDSYQSAATLQFHLLFVLDDFLLVVVSEMSPALSSATDRR